MLNAGLIFTLGFLGTFALSGVGVLFVGELFMALVAYWALITEPIGRSWRRPMPAILLCLGITMLGYVASDVIRGTPLDDILRGWGRLLFLFTNTVALNYLVRGSPGQGARALILFIIGNAAGACIVTFQSGRTYDLWKFGYGLPVSMLVMAGVAALLPARRLLTGGICVLLLTCLHIYLDFRSAAGYTGIIAFTLLYRHLALKFGLGRVSPLTTVCVISVVIASLVLVTEMQTDYERRRNSSLSYRIAGHSTAISAILESPILGYGSWSNSASLQDQFRSGMRADEFDRSFRFEAHSQILQSWYEGGVLATAFFWAMAAVLVSALAYCVLARAPDSLLGLYMFPLLDSLWNVFFGPFAGNQRLDLAISIIIVCQLAAERTVVFSAVSTRFHRLTQAEASGS